jgi:hypothetical protein
MDVLGETVECISKLGIVQQVILYISKVGIVLLHPPGACAIGDYSPLLRVAMPLAKLIAAVKLNQHSQVRSQPSRVYRVVDSTALKLLCPSFKTTSHSHPSKVSQPRMGGCCCIYTSYLLTT